MKNKDYQTLTEGLNKFRMEHQSKTYTREELLEVLCGLGFNRAVASMIIAKFIPSEKMGTSKLYSFGREPISYNSVVSIYKKFSSYGSKSRAAVKEKEISLSEDSELITKVQQLGYQVRKCVGFDMERFKAENPVLYKKYLKYEII